MTAKLTAASPVLYGNTGLKRFQTNSGTDSLFNVALNDSQITVFFYDDYKIKTGSESLFGRLPPAGAEMTNPSSLSLPRRRESRIFKPENSL
jgi:hypothetical protein